jgi:Tol biopolymer transport system component
MGRRLLPLVAALAIPSAQAASPPQVAFSRIDDPPGIWLVDQTGAGATELTRGTPRPTSLGTYSWSPDGSRVVYASGDPLSGGDLYALSVDGGRVERLTSQGRNEHPAWSPDGGRIAYVHAEPSGAGVEHELWVLDVIGGARRRLTTDGGLKERRPSWSPDGSRLLYVRTGPRIGMVVIDAESGRRLLQTGDSGGRWSPDGARIAVQNDQGIAVVEADGSARRTIATRVAEGPEWSPDGSRIAFSRRNCASYFKGICSDSLSSIYSVGADGRDERRLTGPVGGGPYSKRAGHPYDHSAGPAWWPDGSRLFFSRYSRAYVMSADGTCEQPFGPRRLLLGEPAWRPGTRPSLPVSRCVDVRVRAQAVREFYGRRDRPRIRVVVENDGTETATGLVLSLRVARGRARMRPPLRSCRGGAVVRCGLPPLAPGESTQLTVSFTSPGAAGFELRASAITRERDSDPMGNGWSAPANVLDCDVVGTWENDRLKGTPRRDEICGLPGHDVITGGAGADRILAGAGSDTIVPGPGRDVVSGGEGRERIYASDRERDVIDCGASRDTVYADRLDNLVRCERVSRR